MAGVPLSVLHAAEDPGEGTPGLEVLAANVNAFSPATTDADRLALEAALTADRAAVVLVLEKRPLALPGYVRAADNFDDDLPRASHATAIFYREDVSCAAEVTAEFGSDTSQMPLGWVRVQGALAAPVCLSALTRRLRSRTPRATSPTSARSPASCGTAASTRTGARVGPGTVVLTGDLNAVPAARARHPAGRRPSGRPRRRGPLAASWPGGGGWPTCPTSTSIHLLGPVGLVGVRLDHRAPTTGSSASCSPTPLTDPRRPAVPLQLLVGRSPGAPTSPTPSRWRGPAASRWPDAAVRTDRRATIDLLEIDLPPEAAPDLARRSFVQAIFTPAPGGMTLLDADPGFTLPEGLVFGAKYRGKTHELVTQLALNLALDACRAPGTPQLLDPMAGRGTTLLWAARYGISATGVEQDPKALAAAAPCGSPDPPRTHQAPHRQGLHRSEEQGRRGAAGRSAERRRALVTGDSQQLPPLLRQRQFALMVADLPYGVQFHGAGRATRRGAGGLRAGLGADHCRGRPGAHLQPPAQAAHAGASSRSAWKRCPSRPRTG